MSGREFGGTEPTGLGLPDHDLDLLADYLAGVLEGSPDQAEIARRIRDEPRWALASAALAGSVAQVSVGLATLGRSAEPIPDDVAERITTALAGARGAGVGLGKAGRPAASVTAGPRAWWRPAAWLRPVAAAAAVLALFGFGLWMLPHLGGEADTASDAGVSGPAMLDDSGRLAQAGPSSSVSVPPARRVAVTGSDYRRQNLGTALRTQADMPVTAAGSAGAEAGDAGVTTRREPVEQTYTAEGVPAALGRLAAPPALRACLTAVGDAHGRTTAAVQFVDYSTFEGSPALLVLFVDAAGERWAWASGPLCGLPGAGADTLYQTRVG